MTLTQTGSAFVICPLCHTTDVSVTEGAVSVGGHWRCATCDQVWTATRLATAAAYARWLTGRDAVSGA